MSTELIDTRGLLCPLPVIRLQERSSNLSEVVEVTVIATDPGVLEDIPAWCRVNGHVHLGSETNVREYLVNVRLHPISLSSS